MGDTLEEEKALRLSIIVPAHDNSRELPRCLAALAGRPAATEVVVVDDASSDDSGAIARASGARTHRLARNSGPAAARNCGASMARGRILLFVDADVVLAAGAVDRVLGFFAENEEFAALFGSYDAYPAAPGLVSQYRNLLHHYVHQTANPEASTFWAGCGAVRREVFEEVGGFDVRRYDCPAIEDIELGYRLRRAGRRIRLDRGLQATHLKRWTLRTMLATDLFRRALPWARLLRGPGPVLNDLNIGREQRWSVFLVLLGVVAAPATAIWTAAGWIPPLALAGMFALNRPFFSFLARARGVRFAIAAFPLHVAHYACGGLGYAIAWGESWWRRPARSSIAEESDG